MIEDIKFSITNSIGQKINCLLITSISIDENTLNIIYKEENDDIDTFRYGKLIKNNNSYDLTNNITPEEIDELKEKMDSAIYEAIETLAKKTGEENEV